MPRENAAVVILHCLHPGARSAAQRVNGFATYLREFGYNVKVIESNNTVREFGYHFVDDIEVVSFDEKGIVSPLQIASNENWIIRKIKVLFNRLIYMACFDVHSHWTKRAEEHLRKLAENRQVKFVISTFAPVGPHRAALKVRKIFPELVWIADMRDEMSAAPHLTWFERWRMRRLAREVVNTADGVVSVSKPLIEQFKVFSSGDVIFREIRNGYNYTSALPVSEKGARKLDAGNEFCIRYLGSFYGSITPVAFLSALSGIAERLPGVRMEFIGPQKKFSVPDNIREAVEFREAVTYRDATTLMQHSDLLLLFLPSGRRKGVFSGKIFEYLASGVPILGLVPQDDVAADLIRKARAGDVVDGEDIAGIQECILRAYARWQSGELPDVDRLVVEAHHRREQVRRLAALMQEISAGIQASDRERK